MKLSKFWDLENASGKLIVHGRNEIILECESPSNSLEEFNEWVNIAKPIIVEGIRAYEQ